MHLHAALFRWRETVPMADVEAILAAVERLATEVPGLLDITCAKNTSPFADGYTHAILVAAESCEAIDAYRNHPAHRALSAKIEEMEEGSVGVDFAGPVLARLR